MNSSKTLIMYFILLIGLFILLFFTKDWYFEYLANNEEIKTKQTQLEKLEKEVKILKYNKNALKKEGGILKIKDEEISKDYLSKYMTNFDENEFVEYAYSLAEQNNVKLTKLSLNKGKKDKNGFYKGIINLDVSFESEEDMINFLEKLIGKEAKYKFYIEKFKYPMGKVFPGKELKINIELIIYYK